MARKKLLKKKVVITCVLALAVFGGWTLYQQNKEHVDSVRNTVESGVEKVKDLCK